MSGQEIAQRTPQQEVIAQIRSDDFRIQLAAALPEGVSVERFTRITVSALMENPGLADAKVDRQSLYLSIIKAAQIGLLPNGQEAAIVLYGNKATLMPMIGGFRKIAAEHGWMMKTRAVYTLDEFSFTEEPPLIKHTPVIPGGDRGALLCAYAVAVHRDGRRMQTVLFPEEIAKRRGVSKTDNIWKQWTAQMYEKTAGRDLFAELPLDPAEKERALAVDSDRTPAELLYGPPNSGADGSPGNQPAGGEGNPTSAPPAAAGLDAAGYDDEPGVSEPEPEAEPIAGDATEEALQALALAAADYVPPGGKFAAGGSHGPKTIREILDLGPDGAKWLGWALEKVETPPEYAAAVWSFARIFAPAHYQEALAKREVEA